MNIQRNLCFLPNDLHYSGAEGNIRHEMPIHNVEMDPIGFGFFDAARFGGELTEISGQQRRRNNHRREAKVFRDGVNLRASPNGDAISGLL